MEEETPTEKTVAPVEHNLQGDLEEAEFYIQQGLYAEAEKLCKAIMAYQPDCEECRQKLAEIESMLNQEKVSPPPGKATVENLFGDIDFDFASSDSTSAESVEKKVFKTDVDEQIAADDMESHYNLGIAYREMGLLDDAVSEFEKAETDYRLDKPDNEDAELVKEVLAKQPDLSEKAIGTTENNKPDSKTDSLQSKE